MVDGISTVVLPICAVITEAADRTSLPSISGNTSAHGTASRESTTGIFTISCLQAVPCFVKSGTSYPLLAACLIQP